jgi:Ca2+-binding RTX toxin-like protein
MSRSTSHRETKPAASRPARRTLKCESLEKRDLMAAIWQDGLTVVVNGTNARDVAGAFYDGSNIVVTIAGGTSQRAVFPASGVAQISFFGHAGNDEFNNLTNHRLHAWAGDGHDVIFGGGSHDIIHGQGGDDTLYGRAGVDDLTGGDGNDTLNGGVDNDKLSGQAGNDSLRGEAGADLLYGDDGDDTLSGGSGNDMLSGWNGVDFLFGDDGDDKMYGHAGNDSLYGGSGADSLNGGIGNDTLHGGVDGSVDSLEGAAGVDLYILENYYSGGWKRRDTIIGFNSSQDRISDVK